MIEININLVFTIINLIVLYLLMKKFLFGPILNVMEQRKNMIDQGKAPSILHRTVIP